GGGEAAGGRHAQLPGLDVRREPGPACGRAPDLRRLAHGLQKSGGRRDRAAGGARAAARGGDSAGEARRGNAAAAKQPAGGAATWDRARRSAAALISSYAREARSAVNRASTCAPETGALVPSAAKSPSPASAASSSL